MLTGKIIARRVSSLKKKPAVPSSQPSVPAVVHTIVEPHNQTDTSLSSSINSLQEAIHFRPLPPKANALPEDDLSAVSTDCEQGIIESQQPAQSPFQGVSLKDFESQRRMQEEQNRQKKEMLYKAIEQQ